MTVQENKLNSFFVALRLHVDRVEKYNIPVEYVKRDYKMAFIKEKVEVCCDVCACVCAQDEEM